MSAGPHALRGPTMGRLQRGGRQCVRTLVVAVARACLPALVHAQHVQSGSYTGDGTDNRAITGLGFQPDVVIIKSDDAKIATIRTSTMVGDVSKDMTGATDVAANLIQSLDSDGFTVGSDDQVNKATKIIHWIAFKAGSSRLKVGSYTGDGGATKAITGVGFSPELVIILPQTNKETTLRSSASTDSYTFAGTSNASWFSSLDSDGFTVGTDDRVNKSGITYHYVAWTEASGAVRRRHLHRERVRRPQHHRGRIPAGIPDHPRDRPGRRAAHAVDGGLHRRRGLLQGDRQCDRPHPGSGE